MIYRASHKSWTETLNNLKYVQGDKVKENKPYINIKWERKIKKQMYKT